MYRFSRITHNLTESYRYKFPIIKKCYMDLNIEYERSFPTPYAASPLLPLLLMSLAVQKHSPDTKSEYDEEYDYIVVGAGSAGSVVASRLSEIKCAKVLLLEAGKAAPRLTEIPAIARSFFGTEIDWQYVTTPQKYSALGLKEQRLLWPSGKALGGSSIWNAMFYVRGNRRNYDEWAEQGATGWSYKDVLPYFKKLEDNTDLEYLLNGFHAAGGPITASRPEYHPRVKAAEMQAVRNERFKFVDSNAYEQIGFFDYQASIRKGQRCSTAKGYLVPAENRSNLDILPNAMVRKVLIENKRAYGVEFDFNNSIRRVKARKEVILSAGTVNTAQLLILSGIGPMSELKKHKIPLVADLPVGLNFQDHPASLLIYEVNPRLPRTDEELRKEKNIKDYINARIGPLTTGEGFHLQSFLSNSDTKDNKIPDFSVYFSDFETKIFSQIGLPEEGVKMLEGLIANKTIVSCASQLLRPRSLGSVSIQSTDPYAQPVIDPNYYYDYRDIHDMVEGFRMCNRIMNNRAMKRIGAKPLENFVAPGCEEFVNDEYLYLSCIARTILITTSHQVGTARMGNITDPRTVVDPTLRVKGVSGLRVVDASIMPTIPWSNTNIPTIMVAEKASDMIKRSMRCK